jgi:hypothetical protein
VVLVERPEHRRGHEGRGRCGHRSQVPVLQKFVAESPRPRSWG